MNVDYALRRFASWLRVLLVRMSGYDVRIGRGVVIEGGVHLRTFDSGRIIIGSDTAIYSGTLIDARRGMIVIGERALVNRGCVITAGDSIRIGDDALIAERVTIRDGNHRTDAKPYNRAGMAQDPVVIGDNVWIGANATILPGVSLPADTIVGAGAVVSRSPPCAGLLLGVPARLRRRFGDALAGGEASAPSARRIPGGS